MSQTPEERRAYIRGYNRGRARAYDLWRRLADIAQGYRQRLREPVMQRRCQECRRWTRGSSATLWGFCSTDFDGHEPRMWRTTLSEIGSRAASSRRRGLGA
jgi:hypothetical protein